MPSVDTTALAGIFAWVWSQYGKSITDKAGKAIWERLRWEDKALAYGQKVQRLYGTMQILGQAKPVPLEGIFTAVSLLDRLTAWRRYTVAEMEAEFAGRGQRYFYGGEEGNRRDGLAMVRRGANLFILGRPGAGKTTFLKYLALKGVSGELERVPIFIGLKQLADSDLSVFDYVVREFDVCDFPDAAAYLDRLLKSGKAILLFDGLDEVNVADDERARLIGDVENFTRKYVDCQRLITCRLAATNYTFQNYVYVEMADFNADQIRGFVTKWFSGDEKRRELFLSELQTSESKGLRELARVPLLLALLCLGFEETLKLTSRRVELYEEALDALLKKWDSSRKIRRDESYRELSLKRKEQMLAQVAAETFDRAEYFIPKKTLARSFEDFLSRVPNAPAEGDGEVILRAIVAQHGLFIERARDIYSFAHLTFQEYFTARYVVENEARGTLSRLIEHYDNPRYREVFLLTVSQLADAAEFFQLFHGRLAADAQQRPALAAWLRRVARKASSATEDVNRHAAFRAAYISLTLEPVLDVDPSCARYEDLASDSGLDFDPRLTAARDLDRTLARALERARTLARGVVGFDPDLDDSLPRTAARDLAVARALVRSPHEVLLRDLALTRSWYYLLVGLVYPGLLKEWAEQSEAFLVAAAAHTKRGVERTALDGLAKRLAKVRKYGSELDQAGKQELAQQFRNVLEHVGLSFPGLNHDDLLALVAYLQGSRLLLECLQQATVADRVPIRARLLLMPEA